MDEAHGSIGFIGQALIFLGAAAVLPSLCHKLKISVIVGYLLFGVVVGPSVLGRLAEDFGWLRAVVFSEAEQVRLFAEIGVTLLMFSIGLEFSVGRLKTMRRLVFGLGGLQIMACALALGGLALGTGLPQSAALILGGALALSSTAMVMQLLKETKRSTTPLGRHAFGVLLMQDLAVAPLLLMTGFIAGAGGEGGGLWLRAAEVLLGGVLMVALIIVIGRFVARPLLRIVGASRAPDAFMAAALVMALGAAAATAAVGMSAALGAFIGGLLLAESEYRHQIEVDLEPFKGLLLGLFFASIGMSIDLVSIWGIAGAVLAALALLLLVKVALIAGLMRLFGLGWPRALEAGLLLSQAGEFALVIISVASRQQAIPADMAQLGLIVASLSIAITPFLAGLGSWLVARMEREQPAPYDHGAADARLSEHVVILGFGRVGRQVAAVLEAEEIPYIAVDRDAARVSALRREKIPAVFGDASRVDLLRRAGSGDARAIVVTVDDPQAAEAIVMAVRREWRHIPLHCRCRDRAAAFRLRQLGASEVTPETTEASLQLGARLLEAFGTDADMVHRRVQAIRETFMGEYQPPK